MVIATPQSKQSVPRIWCHHSGSERNTYAYIIQNKGESKLKHPANDAGTCCNHEYRRYCEKNTGINASHKKYIQISGCNQTPRLCSTHIIRGTTNKNTITHKPFLRKMANSTSISERYFLNIEWPIAEHNAAIQTNATHISTEKPSTNQIVVI